MAEKKVTIVIKKIDGGGAGAHGGGWKVAFADFMTAMMCFFLVMWLTNQSQDVKAEVASYFSGPSMLEHDFTSYGAELTLEKLFLDLVNEPLKTAQDFLQPADFTPNIMAMGSKRIVLHYVATELGAIAKNVNVDSDNIEFEIPEKFLFENGTANPTAQFVNVMTKIQAVTMGLEDSKVFVETTIYQGSVAEGTYQSAQRIGSNRKDLIANKIKSTFEHATNDIAGSVIVKDWGQLNGRPKPEGMIKIQVRQKETRSDGRKPRPLEQVFDTKKEKDMDVYNDFVKRVSQPKSKK